MSKSHSFIYLYFALFALSLLAFIAVYIPPSHFIVAGFLSFFIPIALILNFGALLFFLIKRKLFFVFPLYILLFGYKHLQATVAIHLNDKTEAANVGLSVLSYNVQFFRTANKGNNKVKDWILSNDADVMCFQEFSNDANSDNLDIIQTFNKNDKYNFVFSTVRNKINRRQSGVAIFSKFPMVNKGKLFFSENEYNKGCFADIKVGPDTVRIINVHLQSTQLDGSDNPVNVNELGEAKSNLFSLYGKLKQSLTERSMQAEALIQFIEKSPYKVIICGDFNSTPYSYVYHLFESSLNNAFETAGNGFGISYGGKLLFFLRIDHQFYDPRLKAIDFRTLDHVKFSDHYPILGTYQSAPSRK